MVSSHASPQPTGQKDSSDYDVAIIGGGPAGATTGSLLLKYEPSLRVVIFERERFPRDHVGESLLPPVSRVLDEMGCWDAIEGANFPIKIGATYRWGRRPELWDFDFFPVDRFRDEPRPAKFQGQRRLTAFQVDRSIYDQILLDHAASLGCEVRQETRVAGVSAEADFIQDLSLETGETVRARHYVDASGNSGIFRRALGLDCDFPSTLRNIAIYGYWRNTDWAVKIGVGATRIQVRSLGYGWIWFIPLGRDRTSIGLVLPAAHYKKTGKRPEELYLEALESEPTISSLLKNATREGNVQTTRDWSFLAQRQVGSNWFLVGESAGFADPILSAGVTMAHIGAQQLAYTLLELDCNQMDANWLKLEFERQQQQRILTHIRFGDFWYTSNTQLTELKEFTSELARDVGLELDPESAWDWISRGGFINEDATVGPGGFNLGALRSSGEFLTELSVDSPLETNNVLRLSLEGAEERIVAAYGHGQVKAVNCYVRDGRVLPNRGQFQLLIHVLKRESVLPRIMGAVQAIATKNQSHPDAASFMGMIPEALEAMIRDGWIRASYDPHVPLSKIRGGGTGFHWNADQTKQ